MTSLASFGDWPFCRSSDELVEAGKLLAPHDRHDAAFDEIALALLHDEAGGAAQEFAEGVKGLGHFTHHAY